MNHRPSILCFGHDLNLLETRKLLLQRDFNVLIACSISELSHLSAEVSPSLLLICHSVKEQECRHLLQVSRALWPACNVLAVRSEHNPETFLHYLPRPMQVPSAPKTLKDKIFELLHQAEDRQANETPSPVAGIGRKPAESETYFVSSGFRAK